MKDVADDLAFIVRNAIAYIKELERQVNELKREAEPVQEPFCAHGVGKTKCSFCSVEDKQPMQEPKPVACSNTFGCRCPKHFTAEPVQEPPEFPPHDDKVHAGAVYWYVGTDGKYYSSNEVKLFMETKNKSLHYEPPKWVLDNFDLIPLYTAPPQPEERNFCSRCGKRTQDIHTCTPP